MTTLALLIENHDATDTGVAARVEVPRSGFQAGRGPAMDWVLADASRHISGHHFDIRYDDGWWLHDLSTNGVFLQGQTQRLAGPYRLSHGDRFRVGHYIIVALINARTDLGPIRPGSLPSFAPHPKGFLPGNPDHDGGAHAGSDTAIPAAAAQGDDGCDDRAVMRAFCAGAGLAPDACDGLDPQAFGHALGMAVRSSTEHIMMALQDRSAAKLFTDAGAYTMLGGDNNNPLKFMPDAVQALEVMFLRPRDGFMAGPEAMDQALADLRLHNVAVFSAMQPAVMELLEDLSPAAIRDRTQTEGGGIAAKARWWDCYAESWDQEAGQVDDGVLERFTRIFTNLYSGLIRRQGR